jgi:hypothetical protein
MRKTAFTTIDAPWTSSEAERMIDLLRNAGLHPVDLGLATPLVPPGTEPIFPIQVPSEEADAAREVFRHLPKYPSQQTDRLRGRAMT